MECPKCDGKGCDDCNETGHVCWICCFPLGDCTCLEDGIYDDDEDDDEPDDVCPDCGRFDCNCGWQGN